MELVDVKAEPTEVKQMNEYLMFHGLPRSSLTLTLHTLQTMEDAFNGSSFILDL